MDIFFFGLWGGVAATTSKAKRSWAWFACSPPAITIPNATQDAFGGGASRVGKNNISPTDHPRCSP